MSRMLRYASGMMMISFFWMALDGRAVSVQPTIRDVENVPGMELVVDGEGQDSKDSAPVLMPSAALCYKTAELENMLLEDGLKILASGLVMERNGPSVVEVWLESKPDKSTGKFAIVRILQSMGMSCILSAGPKMMPGGSYIGKEAQN